ncbi:MAG: hypothetical protein Kow00108_16590 [Calditrichia bacterium]
MQIPEPEVPEGEGGSLYFPSYHPGPDPGFKSFQENALSCFSDKDSGKHMMILCGVDSGSELSKSTREDLLIATQGTRNNIDGGSTAQSHEENDTYKKTVATKGMTTEFLFAYYTTVLIILSAQIYPLCYGIDHGI